MTPQEQLEYLLESIWVPTNKEVLFANITDILGMEAAALVIGTMKAASESNPLMDTIIIAMSTNGLSLSSLERQAVIDQLATAGSWPDAVRDEVKKLGGEYQPRWTTEGYKEEPTLESLTLAANKKEMEDRAVDRLQTYREALVVWDGNSETRPVL